MTQIQYEDALFFNPKAAIWVCFVQKLLLLSFQVLFMTCSDKYIERQCTCHVYPTRKPASRTM